MEETLTEALESLGLGHCESKFPGKRIIYNLETNESLGTFNSAEGWELVHTMRNN